VNGAAAQLIELHDHVIMGSTVQLDDAEARRWEARRISVDEANRIRA
jgi:aspartate 1-decarboxylase